MKNRFNQFKEGLDEARKPIVKMIEPILPFVIAAAVFLLGISIYMDYRLATEYGMDRPGFWGWVSYSILALMALVPFIFRWVYGTDQARNHGASGGSSASASEG